MVVCQVERLFAIPVGRSKLERMEKRSKIKMFRKKEEKKKDQ